MFFLLLIPSHQLGHCIKCVFSLLDINGTVEFFNIDLSWNYAIYIHFLVTDICITDTHIRIFFLIGLNFVWFGLRLAFSLWCLWYCDYMWFSICSYSGGHKICASKMATAQLKIIELDEGWEIMQKGITKMKKILEGQQHSFSFEDSIMLYTYP